jgi:kynureninase
MRELADDARRLDFDDPLAPLRDRFDLPPGTIYLDGNSLGPPSRDALAALSRTIDDWKTLLIGGWTDADPTWLFLAERLGARLAPLIGAHPDEVIATGSTTVNLHQLLATLFDPKAGRTQLLIEAGAFPSDRYALQSHLRLRGLDPATALVTLPPAPRIDPRAVEAALETRRIALAVLPSVVYTSGQLLDMERIGAAARRTDTLLLWDCAHSVGIVPHDFATLQPDGAFWCSYKWLGAGPGAVGGLYLNRRHFGRSPGLAGWFGAAKETLFANETTIRTAPGAAALQIGTTPVLALAPLIGALGVLEAAGIDRLRAGSLARTAFLRRCLDAYAGDALRIETPAPDHERGGHLTLGHPEASRLSRRLRAHGVVPDHRPPDLLRLAPSPLFTSFRDCLVAAQTLGTLLADAYRQDTPCDDSLVP